MTPRLSGEGKVLSPDWTQYVRNVGLLSKPPPVYMAEDGVPTEKKKRGAKK